MSQFRPFVVRNLTRPLVTPFQVVLFLWYIQFRRHWTPIHLINIFDIIYGFITPFDKILDLQLFSEYVISAFSGKELIFSVVGEVFLDSLVRLTILRFDVSYPSSYRYVLRNDLFLLKSFIVMASNLIRNVLLLVHYWKKSPTGSNSSSFIFALCMMMMEPEFCKYSGQIMDGRCICLELWNTVQWA